MKLLLPNGKQLIHSPLYSEASAAPYTLEIVSALEEGAYVPLSERPAAGTKVYSDLLAYPFTLPLQQVAAGYETLKGVVRFRRTAEQPFPIAEDLYALSFIFGDVQHVTVRERELEGVSACIVLCKLGDVMAHVEYVTGAARIELEWSAEEHIVEFDSAAMYGDAHNNRTLHYHLDAILQHVHEFDVQRLEAIEQLVQGGGRA